MAHTEIPSMPGLRVDSHRVAVVTGASSGIGRATAVELAKAGFDVWAGARRAQTMASLGEHGIKVLPLDVTDDASMRLFVDAVLAGAGRIDVLVNNAGIGGYGAVEDLPLSAGREQFEVNLFGLARMIQLVLPGMRERESGRIINISSMGAKIYEPFAAWYHASKYAVEGFSDSLRLELKPFGIDVCMVEPGLVQSEWNAKARKNLVSVSKGGAYEKGAKRMARMLALADRRSVGSNPKLVADVVVAAAMATHPRTRYAVGAGAKVAVTARRVLPDRAMDAVLGRLG
ncbi:MULTISPECIES: oxidoreductase [unclassified Luteococcus]|uniref:oxidoreductase n=1 Tax=unclassified Luteococcus TaxID=2639923 RepID=UPI00313B67C8